MIQEIGEKHPMSTHMNTKYGIEYINIHMFC